jgi:hypothetical protein
MFDAETEVQALKEEVMALTGEVHTLQRQANSRRGPEGGRGPIGLSGKDAVLKIVQADGKVQVVDLEGTVHAELIPVPGRDGKDGPGLDDVIKAVIEHLKIMWTRAPLK